MADFNIKDNLRKVLDDIQEATIKAGREADSVTLCAVSKFHPVESVVEAMDAGQILFGENRVQEAYAKFTELGEKNRKFDLHIIGSLQLNKVKKALEVASCIQSVDREELLAEIEKQAAKLSKQINVFFEIHTGEDSKSGYTDEKTLFDSIENCLDKKYPHICPVGLMTMAPFVDDERIIRKSFVTLRNLREKINATYPSIKIKDLSMGMSGDFKIAIEEGSTIVRVGTAIFGNRPAKLTV